MTSNRINFHKENNSPWRYSIGKRMLIYIMLFSSLVTFINLAAQLYSEYRRDLGFIETNMKQISKSYVKSMSAAVWSFDERIIRVEMESIHNLPDIAHVKLNYGENMYLSIGATPKDNFFERSFPLTYTSENNVKSIGTLHVVASLEEVYQRLQQRVIIILLTQSIKTFLISAFIFYLFHIMVGRHLNSMANYARSLSLDKLDKPFVLNRPEKHYKEDELEIVANSINEMRKKMQQDMAEQKKMEAELINAKNKAEESDRLKSAFLNNMSHEIRTPMNAIMGFSEMMLTAPPEKINKFASTIFSNSEQLLALIDSVMCLSQLQSETQAITNTEFNPAELVSSIYQTYMPSVLEKKINLIFNIPLQHKSLTIYSDVVKIEQILASLVSNAIKYTNAGNVEIGFNMKNSSIEFYVKDTGIGISAQEQPMIFKNFYRGEQSLSNAIRGTGLGLSIANELLKTLDGTLEVSSKPEIGSCFSFTIPLELTHIKNALPEVISKNLADLNILIAEDENTNYLYIEALLQDKVKQIDLARNGREAIELSIKKHYDLILMDLKMPIMDGIEATKKIKELFPNLPVIAQTAYASTAEKARAMQAGCDEFITKPFKKEILIATIKKTLNKIMPSNS